MHPCIQSIHTFRCSENRAEDNKASLAGNTYTYMPLGKRINHTSMHSAVQRRHSDYTIGIHSDLVIHSREQGIRLSNIRHLGNTNMQGRGVASKSKRANRGGEGLTLGPASGDGREECGWWEDVHGREELQAGMSKTSG